MQAAALGSWRLKGDLAQAFALTLNHQHAPDRIETVAELPYQLHVDHPERLELWPEAGPEALLIIYDAPAPEQTDPDTFTVLADVICPRQAKAGPVDRLLHAVGARPDAAAEGLG